MWLAIGCANSEPKPDSSTAHGDGDGDGAVDENSGGAGGMSGAGGAGAGAGGDGGAGTGGNAGGPACSYELPGVYACVQGDGIAFPEVETHLELIGTVEHRGPDSGECAYLAASRTVGFEREAKGQTYLVSDGEAAIWVTLRTGSARPLLAVGQRVRVTVDSIPSLTLSTFESVTLSVRDDTDGRILYWFAHSELQGLDQLELPAGFTASNAQPTCEENHVCGGTRSLRSLALLEGSEEVVIAPGEMATIGSVEALLISNSERKTEAGGKTCFDDGSFHQITLALFDRDLITKCDWREEYNCTADDDCRDVRASFVGTNADGSFFACVEDSSCGDGDLVTCAIDDATEQLAEFTTTCVPPGWTKAPGACDPDGDAGSM